MAYVLSDIVVRVQQRVRDSSYDDDEITNYLNDTINDVYNEYRLPFMEVTEDYTLTQNVADITNGGGLPDDFVQAIDLTLTTLGIESKLAFVDYRELDQYRPDAADTTRWPANVPTQWYKFGETINVFPVPNTAYTVTLRYYKSPTMLADATDVPDIPAQFVEMLVMGAAYRVLQVKDNYDQAGVLQNKYDELLDKLVMKYSRPQTGSAIRMRMNTYALGKRFF